MKLTRFFITISFLVTSLSIFGQGVTYSPFQPYQVTYTASGGSGSTTLIAGSNVTIVTNAANNFTISSTGGAGGGIPTQDGSGTNLNVFGSSVNNTPLTVVGLAGQNSALLQFAIGALRPFVVGNDGTLFGIGSSLTNLAGAGFLANSNGVGTNVTFWESTTSIPQLTLQGSANPFTNYLNILNSSGAMVGGFTSNASVRVNAGTASNVAIGQANGPTNGIFFTTGNSVDVANWGTNSFSVTNGNTVIRGAIVTAGAVPPTVTAGTGAGSAPSNVQVDATSNDTVGNVSLTTGTSPTASGTIVTVTFATVKDRAPRVFILSTTTSSALGAARVYVSSTTTGFSVVNDSTALGSASAYAWNYLCVQ